MTSVSRPPRSSLVGPGGIEHMVADMTVIASADVTLGSLQAELAKAGQWLPIDGDPGHSLGRLIDTNSTGPMRLGYGAWRDLLLGVQFTNGREELISAGGLTVKNVAGYDLTKFMVGAGGIFGQVQTLVVRTYRRPAGAIVAESASQVDVLPALLTTVCRPHWAILTPDRLYCGYHGDARAIAFYGQALAKTEAIEFRSRSLDADVDLRNELWSRAADDQSAAMRFRASVPPSRVLDFVQSLRLPRWSADAAFGIVPGACADDSYVRTVRGVAASMGGTATFWRRDGTMAYMHATAQERAILTRLKAAFDPDKRLPPLPRTTLE